MGATIAIVGASGFIGRALARHCTKAGHQVTGYGSKPAALSSGVLSSGVALAAMDVTQGEVHFPAGTQAVFYLAQSPGYRDFPSRAEHLFAVNTQGAIKAACAAREAGARLFCYASTGNVYLPSFEPLDEQSPVRRDNGYALSKVMAEEALALLAGPMRVVSARLFGVFGPGQEGMICQKIRDRICAGQPVLLDASPAGEDDGLRVSLCLVDDAAACLLALVELDSAGVTLPARLNIAGPEPISIKRMGSRIAQSLGLAARFAPSGRERPGDLVADISRLACLFPHDFTAFDDGIARTFGRAAA